MNRPVARFTEKTSGDVSASDRIVGIFNFS
jgi:hypothetical protein